jgi:thymidylate synthase
MNSLDKQYTDLLQDILDNGVTKQDRTGTGTLSVFGRQIRHKMSEGFPLLTTKKIPFRLIVTELLWFLRGDTNIKYLVDNDCHIWDGDAYKNYERRWETEGKFLSPPVNKFTKEEFINEIKTNPMVAKELGDLGPIYGAQWRAFGGYNKVPSGWDHGSVTSFKDVSKCDQLENLINDLKTNPDSRRLMVTAWNPGELYQMVLPPCHYGFQVYTRELSYEERCDIFKPNTKNFRTETNSYIKDLNIKIMNDCEIPTRAISLMWNQRSVDTFLGLPFNIASYGLLLEIIAKLVNMVPDELIGNLGDTHLYLNHIEQAKEQIGRELSLEERCKLANFAPFDDRFPDGDGFKWDEHTINIAEDWLKQHHPNLPTRTREPYPLPILDIHPGILDYDMEKYPIDLFEIKDYQSHPTIKAPLSN